MVTHQQTSGKIQHYPSPEITAECGSTVSMHQGMISCDNISWLIYKL